VKIVPKKATYSRFLLDIANDHDKATLLDLVLRMVEVSANGEVTIKLVSERQGYEFIRNDEPRLPQFKEIFGDVTQPRTLESDLREDR
jgi:hypothetical protein